MTNHMKLATAAMLLVGTFTVQAQNVSGNEQTTHKAKAAARKPDDKKTDIEAELLHELKELRTQQAAQQVQIDALTKAIAAKDAALQQAAVTATQATKTAEAATAQTQAVAETVKANTEDVKSIKSTIDDIQTLNTGIATTISNNKVEINDKVDSPSGIHYKGVTITPVAFFAAESVYRQRSVNSDINSPFNNIPFMGADEAHTSEFNFSGRQSRIGGLFEGKTKGFKLSGYFESDFLGAGTTSNGNQSNSFVLRQRQIWGQATTDSGLSVTGGQMWSLVTENGKSTDNRTEKLPNAVDAQYTVGFSWARQPAVRVQQKFLSADGKKALTAAIAIEEGQITNFNATNSPSNFFINGPGQNGGLFNAFNGTPTNNLAPDVIVKVAADLPKAHFELGGVSRFFRARVYPAISNAATGYVGVTGTAAYNDIKLAGGIFGNARVSPSKYVDVALGFMAGDGVGRYGSSQLADATVHPNGKLEPIRNYHGLLSLETHPNPKLDVYGYVGGEYAQRTVYATGVTGSPFTGYAPVNVNLSNCNTEVASTTGASGGVINPATNCAAATKDIWEGLAGFTYRITNNPKYGRLQYQMNYQYITRIAWTGLTSGTYGTPSAVFGSPKAVDNMIFTSFRYYIP